MPSKSTQTNKHSAHTHGLSPAVVMFEAALVFFTQPLVVFKPAYFLLITANGLLFGGSAGKTAWYMWLLFVRNGACGGGGEKRRKEGSQRSTVEMQSLRASLCGCVNVCSFEKETGCVFGVRTGFRALACVCRVRERETGQRVKVITL